MLLQKRIVSTQLRIYLLIWSSLSSIKFIYSHSFPLDSLSLHRRHQSPFASAIVQQTVAWEVYPDVVPDWGADLDDLGTLLNDPVRDGARGVLSPAIFDTVLG